MPSQFKVVGIYGRASNPGVIDSLKALMAYLHSIGQAFVVDTDTAKLLGEKNIKTVAPAELSKAADLIMVVGGDGSILHAAHTVIDNNIPVLGINRGRLGFLTDIHPTALQKIKTILEGAYRLEKRFLLETEVTLNEKIIGKGIALNEVALIPDSMPHMSEFEIFIEKQFVCSQDSDGLIVATPTGSTAYALSGGGPILHPQLDAMVIVPMFPHTLSMRPIVIDANQHITIIITPNNVTTPRLTCDSQALINTPKGSHIAIRKAKYHLNLIHPLDYDYYESLRSKLHWGKKLHYAE